MIAGVALFFMVVVPMAPSLLLGGLQAVWRVVVASLAAVLQYAKCPTSVDADYRAVTADVTGSRLPDAMDALLTSKPALSPGAPPSAWRPRLLGALCKQWGSYCRRRAAAEATAVGITVLVLLLSPLLLLAALHMCSVLWMRPALEHARVAINASSRPLIPHRSAPAPWAHDVSMPLLVNLVYACGWRGSNTMVHIHASALAQGLPPPATRVAHTSGARPNGTTAAPAATRVDLHHGKCSQFNGQPELCLQHRVGKTPCTVTRHSQPPLECRRDFTRPLRVTARAAPAAPAANRNASFANRTAVRHYRHGRGVSAAQAENGQYRWAFVRQ
jgi:hypothetical protein